MIPALTHARRCRDFLFSGAPAGAEAAQSPPFPGRDARLPGSRGEAEDGRGGVLRASAGMDGMMPPPPTVPRSCIYVVVVVVVPDTVWVVWCRAVTPF